jgi:condensin complex subunit 2
MSRKSQATGSGGDVAATDSPLVSPQAPHDDHAAEYAADDWGADDDDDVGFTDFIQNDDNGKRYSSISFQNESFFESQQEQTGALLDALYAEIGSQNDYQYFSQQSLDRLAGNQWAGSLHWKTSSWQKKKTSATVDDKKTKATTTTRKKKRSFVDFTLPSSSDFLQKPAKPSSIVLSTAIQTKYGKADNLLPLDAGMTVQELTKLFLRPSAVIKPATTNSSKTVGFHAENDVIFDDGSLGGDDDGPGFAFAGDDDDFVVQDFDDVRKVDKIQVGYATVAKKVDVKRLKKDLWSELETNFELEEENYSEKENNKPVLSFKDTVSEMETHKSQSDVTLPFYFICLLHLANEKGLRLESQGLGDFLIVQEDI